MTTARQIITKAMQKIGVLTKTEQPSGDEINDGLSSLNAMISSWSNESMLIYARVLESFPLTSGVSQYSIGAGQTFNTARPNFISNVYTRNAGSDYSVDVSGEEYYSQIPDKDALGRPQVLIYSNSYPYGQIKLWPVPDLGYSLFLLSEKTLSSLVLDDVVDLPPGWEQALIYNLAIMLSPEYGQPVSAEIFAIAGDSKAAIERAIMRNRTMDCEPVPFSRGNFYTGY